MGCLLWGFLRKWPRYNVNALQWYTQSVPSYWRLWRCTYTHDDTEIWEGKLPGLIWQGDIFGRHCDDVVMGAMASQITSLTIVYSIVYSGRDQSKHQSSASLAFVRGIHRGPVNSPQKGPVTRKMFPFDDVIVELMEIQKVVICLYADRYYTSLPTNTYHVFSHRQRYAWCKLEKLSVVFTKLLKQMYVSL